MRRKSIVIIVISIVLLLAMIGIMCCVPFEKDYGEYLLLSTPIGELYFTERWEDCTVTEEIAVNDGYAVNISAQIGDKTVLLYELYIGTQTEEGFLIGYINDMEIRVDVPDVELDSQWTQKNIDIINTMQEDLGCMLDQIVEMDGFRTSDTSGEETFGEFVLLTTPIGEIYFTEQWKNHIVVSEVAVDEGYAVEISAETDSGAARLCTLYIGSGDLNGTLIGYVNGMAVRIDEPEIVLVSGWTDTDINIVYSMQEDLNCIIDQVVGMEGFHKEESNEALTENFGEYVLLSTPLGELYFTERWKDSVAIEEIAVNEGYAVSISAQTASGTVKLYELSIGTETGAGFLLGYIDGVEIWLDVPVVELGNGWTEADSDVVYAIQDDLDCIVDQIIEMEGFASA